jgi:hypothetical protein
MNIAQGFYWNNDHPNGDLAPVGTGSPCRPQLSRRSFLDTEILTVALRAILEASLAACTTEGDSSTA